MPSPRLFSQQRDLYPKSQKFVAQLRIKEVSWQDNRIGMSAELEIFFHDGMTGGIQRKQREGRFTMVYPTANQFPYANGAAAISAREKFC